MNNEICTDDDRVFTSKSIVFVLLRCAKKTTHYFIAGSCCEVFACVDGAKDVPGTMWDVGLWDLELIRSPANVHVTVIILDPRKPGTRYWNVQRGARSSKRSWSCDVHRCQ